jgi:precorrin-6B methylase 2
MSAAIWQQVEFGSYAADLPLWLQLAADADGPVVELGAGAGRVSLQLADAGHEVVAVERDPDLSAELERTARERRLQVSVVSADLASPSDLSVRKIPTLAIGPLHLIQVLEGPARSALLERLRVLMARGGTVALTVVDESTLLSAGAAATITGGRKHSRQILPDMRELDGWVYSSEPLWVQVGDRALTVRRLRERVSPEGRMEREIHDEVLQRVSPERLEGEAAAVGLRPAGRRQIKSGADEADSTVILLEVAA